MDVLPLVQQQHGPQVPYSLVGKLLWRDQLQTFQLQNKHVSKIRASWRYVARSEDVRWKSGNLLVWVFFVLIYLPEMCRITQHVHVQQLCHIPTAISVVFFSEGRADGRAFFLDHLSLLGLGPSRPDGPDQLPQSDRSWHPLWLE